MTPVPAGSARRAGPAGDPRPAVEVEVRALAAGGDGVGRLPDGRTVFLPRTAPGDVVLARVHREARRWARARVVRLVHPSGHRQEPPCPSYGACGGCALQHVRYEEQVAWKRRFVTDALSRIGGRTELPAVEVHPAPEPLAYRSRVTFTLRRLGGERVVAGYHHREDAHRVVDVDTCFLAEAPLVEAWRSLRRGWGTGARLLPEGRTLRLTLRGTAEGAVLLLVEGGRAGWDGAELARAVSALGAVWHRPRGADDAARVAGAPLEEVIEGRRIPLAPASFLQVHRTMGDLLTRHVVRSAAGPGPVVDAYCGVGRYGRLLADTGLDVVGIEADPSACRAAALDAPASFRVLCGRVEERLRETPAHHTVILNPPRSGLHERVPTELARRPPRRIVYVSCDPATLARDLRRIGEEWTLRGLTVFDLFPQTAHVETVAVLERGAEA